MKLCITPHGQLPRTGMRLWEAHTRAAGEALRAASDAGPPPDAALLAGRVFGVRRRQRLPFDVAGPRRVSGVGCPWCGRRLYRCRLSCL